MTLRASLEEFRDYDRLTRRLVTKFCLKHCPSCTVNSSKFFKQCKSSPITGLDKARRFQEAEDPIFQDNRHMKVVRLSALRTGRLYTPGNIPGTHFC